MYRNWQFLFYGGTLLSEIPKNCFFFVFLIFNFGEVSPINKKAGLDQCWRRIDFFA
jgi:hypothetical protein